MFKILLINPNSSDTTTAMMVRIASDAAPEAFHISGLSAQHGPSMLVTPAALAAAAVEVERVWLAAGTGWHGVIVGAFGDPGLDLVRRRSEVPVVGICEASMHEAAQGGRRFGVATTTPALADSIGASAAALGLADGYTGTRLTEGDPHALVADPKALEEALAVAVRRCIEDDGAQAVVIGGGPLGQAALGLSGRFGVPVIGPIPAAVRRLARLLQPA